MSDEIIENELSGNSGELENQKPIVIETFGKWQPFEYMSGKTFEVGKIYRVKVNGDCQLMISPTKPTSGFGSKEICFRKDDVNRLWIKTGKENDNDD